MSRSNIWLAYDLGVRGDYQNLYSWLDERHASECGDSLAYLMYEYDGELKPSLKRDLESAISVTSRTRIYVIYKDAQTKKIRGTFILGGRKAPPWTGFALEDEEQVQDEL